MFDVKNLSVAYGQSEVLHGIDLSVEPGEIVAVAADATRVDPAR